MPKQSEEPRQKVDITITDDGTDQINMKVEFDPEISDEKGAQSAAVYVATQFLKFIGGEEGGAE